MADPIPMSVPYLPPVLLPPVFSARERQVIFEAARGRSTKQIARLLDLSPRTIEAHLSRIYRRLPADWRSRAGLARMAARAGWVD